MNDIKETYQLGMNLYQRFSTKIDEMYQKVGNKLGISYEELIEEMNQYLISLSLVVSQADKMIKESELEFINYVFKTNFNVDNIDLNNHLSIINKIPSFVKLSVYTDKAYDAELKVIKPTYCQTTYDFLLRFPTYLKFSDGHVPEEEDITLKKSLNVIVDYYKKNYVRYARQRKED